MLKKSHNIINSNEKIQRNQDCSPLCQSCDSQITVIGQNKRYLTAYDLVHGKFVKWGVK